MAEQQLAIGQAYKAGVFAGITTNKQGEVYVLVLLDAVPDKALTWKSAKVWASQQGEGAGLPTRAESALLFALLKYRFSSDWYWTDDEWGDQYAFTQNLINGHQHCYDEGYKFRARAVLRVPLRSYVLDLEGV